MFVCVCVCVFVQIFSFKIYPSVPNVGNDVIHNFSSYGYNCWSLCVCVGGCGWVGGCVCVYVFVRLWRSAGALGGVSIKRTRLCVWWLCVQML